MGQKIHPFGFRVGITKKHQSVWFARFHKHQYAQSVLEDRFLRENLEKILPQLLEKQFQNSSVSPKISHIQIIRGLIPYEIGIQIHAQNCHLIKNAFQNFDFQPVFLQNVLKNHVLLREVQSSQGLLTDRLSDELQTSEKTEKKAIFSRKEGLENAKKAFRPTVRERFLGKFKIVKNGKTITRKFDQKNETSLKKNLVKFFQKTTQDRQNSRKMKFLKTQKTFVNFFETKKTQKNFSKDCSKFVNFYLSQTNRSFLEALKEELTIWNQYFQNSRTYQFQKFGSYSSNPFGSQKKWNLQRLQRFEKLPFSMVFKLYKALQQKALKKLERLRKEYVAFGKFSKRQTLDYYQRIRFLQSFKKLLSVRKTQKTVLLSANFENLEKLTNQKFASKTLLLSKKVLDKKFSKTESEKNTGKFIEYLQDAVQHHRSKHLFLYLATIADARKHYRKIQKFTKDQSEYLFGISLKNLHDLGPLEKEKIFRAQVQKTFSKLSENNLFQTKNFHDLFLEQLQKQRFICEKNMQLIPKISLQFYSVKAQNFETKASVVADSIVDDLEKRKAFRRVIKKAKEDLMKTSKVKGVKIQVSGRLNGAEIARSEWVRAGRVPLQTLRANIDYCYKTAQTIYGIIGVKVWIYKGYTKVRKPSASVLPTLSDLL
jgi:ribosomal protein S3